jgi:preprotein translocase subunit YajC
MNLTDLVFLAQAAAPAPGGPEPSPFISLAPLIFIFIIFYFLLIRPQQKRAKEHAALVAAIKTGDRVVTSGGMHGIVANVKDKTVLLKVADNVKVEFDRAAITSVEKGSEADAK